jgi:2-haloacid dehalogenase
MGIAVFDINETTLNLEPVRATVDELVGPEGGFIVWFQKLLQLSMTTTAIGQYIDFTTLARDALTSVAATSGRELAPDAMPQLGAAFGKLSAYEDVVSGLTTLREANWQTIALTNSASTAVETQLEAAGLTELFDHIVSVEAVKSYKPSSGPYLHVADMLGTEPSDLLMVACHDWDLAGARATGYRTAFVQRPGMSYADTYPAPDFSVADFVELAETLTT